MNEWENREHFSFAIASKISLILGNSRVHSLYIPVMSSTAPCSHAGKDQGLMPVCCILLEPILKIFGITYIADKMQQRLENIEDLWNKNPVSPLECPAYVFSVPNLCACFKSQTSLHVKIVFCTMQVLLGVLFCVIGTGTAGTSENVRRKEFPARRASLVFTLSWCRQGKVPAKVKQFVCSCCHLEIRVGQSSFSLLKVLF